MSLIEDVLRRVRWMEIESDIRGALLVRTEFRPPF